MTILATDDDDGPERRCGEHRLPLFPETPVNKGHRRLGVRHDMLQPWPPEGVIDSNLDRTQIGAPEPTKGAVRTVRKHREHEVTGLDADAGQCAGPHPG